VKFGILKTLTSLMFSVCLLCLIYGFFIEPRRLVVRQISIGEGDQHIKIALLGDFHMGGFHMRDQRVKSIVRKVNGHTPDIILIAGDFISGHGVKADRSDEFNDRLLKGLQNLSALSAPKGIYAALGNHDAWYDKHFIETTLTQNDIVVLDNKAKRVADGLCLVGLADHDTGQEDRRAYEDCPAHSRVITMMHSPDSFSYQRSDTILGVAGHTHGGQINLPILGRAVTATQLGKPYAYGLKDWGGIPVFITAGLGTSIIPARFRSPPEIVLIDLSYSADQSSLSPDNK